MKDLKKKKALQRSVTIPCSPIDFNNLITEDAKKRGISFNAMLKLIIYYYYKNKEIEL